MNSEKTTSIYRCETRRGGGTNGTQKTGEQKVVNMEAGHYSFGEGKT